MTHETRIISTDDDIDAALAQGRLAAVHLPRAVRAEYRPAEDAIVVELDSGVWLSFPRRLLQGLEHAALEQLAEIEIVGPGTGLHWSQLDVDHYLPGLLQGVFGTRRWMAEIGRRGGRRAVHWRAPPRP